MNITPDALSHRLDHGLAPAIAEDPELRALAMELGREILDYGISVLPRTMFRGRSGADVAGMVAEDLEAALWMKDLIAPREVEVPAPPPEEGEEPAPPTIERVPPRVVEFGTGWGITAFLLAHLYPDQPFELVDASRDRMWWWRRLNSLYGVRNLKIREIDTARFVASNEGALDVAIVKRMAPDAALEFAVPSVREGGHVLVFQRSDRTAEIRRRRTTPDGHTVRLRSTLAFESPAARGRVLASVGVGVPTLDARESAA